MTHLLIYRKRLLKLIHLTQSSWLVDQFKTEHQKSLRYPLTATRLFILFYFTSILVCGTLYVLSPIFLGTGKLPYMTYPESKGLSAISYIALYISEVALLLMPCTIVSGADGLFIYFNAYVITHIRMIKITFLDCFSSKNELLFRTKLNSAIKIHIHVLRLIKELNSIYSLIVLNQFLSSLIGICISLFLLHVTRNPLVIANVVKYILLAATLVFQVGVYCYVGNQLSLEYSSLSDSLFYQIWFTDASLIDRNTITMIIQLTQKNQAVSVGGFAPLDLSAFIKLLQQSLSFFTFLQVMFDEK